MKTAADTFRPNPAFDAFEVITQLGVGEALVSTLEKKGIPSIVQRTLIRPPSSRLGPLEDEERGDLVKNSAVYGLYDEAQDRESAYETLRRQAEEKARREEERRRLEEEEERRAEEEKRRSREARRSSRSSHGRQTVTEAALKSVVRSMSSQLGRRLGRELVRGILGGLARGR